MIRIPAKLFIAIMLVAGVVTFFYGIATGDANTILGSFVFFGIGGGIYLFFARRDSILSISPAGDGTKKVQASASQTPPAVGPISRPLSEMELGTLGLMSKYPGCIPRSGVPVADMALEIGFKLATHFDFEQFEKILVQEHSIEKSFVHGWTLANAHIVWRALAFICLSDCRMTMAWTDSFTLETGTQIYYAAIESVWLAWLQMPEIARKSIFEFMKTNVPGITGSLREIVDDKSAQEWFSRYAVRIKGGFPPWDLSKNVANQKWEDFLWQCTSDKGLADFLHSHYRQGYKSIMNLVTGVESGVIVSNRPIPDRQ